MKRDIVWTTKFKKDYKLAIKRHMDINLLDNIIRVLSRGEKLPDKHKDHELRSRPKITSSFWLWFV